MGRYQPFVDILDMFVPRTRVNMPAVKNIIFNKDITKVVFEDGTWALVRLSENDEPNREVAVLYALAKRIYGKISYERKNYGEAVESGIGAKLRKWVAGAFDQEAADKAKRAAEKAKAKPEMKKPEVKKPCTGCTCTEAPYVRPDKPFSQFTAEEKRAYWREQNRKRRI